MLIRLVQALVFCGTILTAGRLLCEVVIGSDYYGFERRLKRGLVGFAVFLIASVVLVVIQRTRMAL